MSGVSSLFAGVAKFNQALDYHLERHNVLATNVAHVDTPRYRPSDLARIPDESFQEVMQTALRRTNESHLSNGATRPVVGEVFQDLSAGGGADGNFVSLDREAAKIGANKIRYDVVSALVRTELEGLLYAAGNGQS